MVRNVLETRIVFDEERLYLKPPVAQRKSLSSLQDSLLFLILPSH